MNKTKLGEGGEANKASITETKEVRARVEQKKAEQWWLGVGPSRTGIKIENSILNMLSLR